MINTISDFQTHESFARELDTKDPLKKFRDRFYLPPNTIYLDGNSLGLMPKETQALLNHVLDQWKTKAIGGWLDESSPWFYFAEKRGALCANLVGAFPQEVICTGTTTVNIHSLLSSFYKPQGKRSKILADELNFPSDIYALKGQIKLRGLDPQEHLVLVPSRDGRTLEENDIIAAMTDEIAVAFLPSVLYRSGQLLDLPLLTQKAHEKGILIGFDCSHSVGAVPHHFSRWGVDFALWCSYKYLNGGPGSPAFLYIDRKHFREEPLLAGWFGSVKEKQFEMRLEFEPSPSAGGWQISSPGILGAAALEGCLNIFQEAGIEAVREKSLRLTSYLVYLVDHILPEDRYHIKIGTPRDPRRRSGHVAVEGNEELWRIHQALKARGIIPDFRPPGLIRFAPIALYNTYHEVWQTIHQLKDIIDTKAYESFNPEKPAIT